MPSYRVQTSISFTGYRVGFPFVLVSIYRKKPTVQGAAVSKYVAPMASTLQRLICHRVTQLSERNSLPVMLKYLTIIREYLVMMETVRFNVRLCGCASYIYIYI
jgi:hypothetical protein